MNALLTGNGGLNKLGAGTWCSRTTIPTPAPPGSPAARCNSATAARTAASPATPSSRPAPPWPSTAPARWSTAARCPAPASCANRAKAHLILTGNNTLTGVTRIDGGTLQIGNRGNTGSLTGDIVNNGELLFRRSDNWTYAGSLSGSGATGILGDSTLTLLGNSSAYTGTLTVYSDSALQVEGKLGGTVKTSVRTVLSGTGTSTTWC
ncbi:autotransporter-associated beta strand repeat-containing protein [Achromobacter xylosoxidans]